MYARVTHYKMMPDSIAAATARMEQLKPQILAMPGMVRFINAMDDTGAGYVISLVESKELSDANQDKVKALWSNFSDFLAEAPSPQGFELIADWSN